MQRLPHQHEYRGRDAHNRQRGRHADALGHVPQLRHRARVHLPSRSRQRGLGAVRREAACIRRCQQGCTCCMCFSRSMQCGTHAIVQSSSFCTLSNEVNMADTSFVMEMTTCRGEHDVLVALYILVRLQGAASKQTGLPAVPTCDCVQCHLPATTVHMLQIRSRGRSSMQIRFLRQAGAYCREGQGAAPAPRWGSRTPG